MEGFHEMDQAALFSEQRRDGCIDTQKVFVGIQNLTDFKPGRFHIRQPGGQIRTAFRQISGLKTDCKTRAFKGCRWKKRAGGAIVECIGEIKGLCRCLPNNLPKHINMICGNTTCQVKIEGYIPGL